MCSNHFTNLRRNGGNQLLIFHPYTLYSSLTYQTFVNTTFNVVQQHPVTEKNFKQIIHNYS